MILIRKNIILMALIMASAFFLRIYGINWGLPSPDYNFSYHSDENHYLRGLSQMQPRQFNFNPHYFNWGTWHYYELAGTLGLAGFLNIIDLKNDMSFYYSNSWQLAKIFLAGRILSVFFGLLTVFLVYLIGRKMVNTGTGLLASFFMAINPAHIVHSHYLKADASVTFWTALLLLSAAFLLESGKLRWYIFAGIISAFASSAQHSGIFFAHAVLLAHLLRGSGVAFNYRSIADSFFSKKVILAYLAAALTYLIINPSLYLSPNEYMAGLHNLILAQKSGSINTVLRPNMLIDTLKIFNVSLTAPFTVLIITGFIFGLVNFSNKNLLLFFYSLPYLAAMIIKGTLNTRYQILVFTPLFILVASQIYFYYLRLKNNYVKLILAVSAALFSLFTIIYAYAYDKLLAGKTVQQEAAQWIYSNIPQKAKIGTLSEPDVTNCPTIVHQEYYYKSHNYNIVNLNGLVSNLKRESPDYIILSKRESVYDLPKVPQNVLDFIREVKKDYTVIKTFEKYPSFLNLSFKPGIFISDWEIPFPVIYIFKKSN